MYGLLRFWRVAFVMTTLIGRAAQKLEFLATAQLALRCVLSSKALLQRIGDLVQHWQVAACCQPALQVIVDSPKRRVGSTEQRVARFPELPRDEVSKLGRRTHNRLGSGR